MENNTPYVGMYLLEVYPHKNLILYRTAFDHYSLELAEPMELDGMP